MRKTLINKRFCHCGGEFLARRVCYLFENKCEGVDMFRVELLFLLNCLFLLCRSSTEPPSGEFWTQVITDEFKDSLRRVVKQGYVDGMDSDNFYIVDLGAHYGEWTNNVHNLNLFPNAKYILIEANEAATTVLNRMNVKYAIALLSDEDGKEVDYYMCSSEHCGIDTGNSIYAELTATFHKHATVQRRKSMTLDSLLDMNGLSDITIGVMKLDIQGSELAALRGAKHALSRVSGIIIMEVSILPYNGADAPSFFDIHAFMHEQGWVMVEILEKSYGNQGKRELLVQMDVVFVRREKAKWSGVSWPSVP